MKSPVYFLAAIIVAFSATVFAFPSFYKRAANTARVAQCLVTGFAAGGMADDCKEAVKQNAGLILGFASVNINIDFTKAAGIALDSPGVSATLLPFKGLNWKLAKASHKENNVEVAVFVAPEATVGVVDGVFKSNVPESTLSAVPGQETLFEQAFLGSLIRNAEHIVTLRAVSNFLAESFVGTFNIVDFASEASITLKGCNNFANSQFQKLVSFTLDKATGIYTLVSDFTFVNPSSISLTMGDVTWQTVDKNNVIFGTSAFKNVTLSQDKTTLTGTTTFKSKEVYDALISTGLDFTLRGFEGSSKNPTVARAMVGAAVHLTISKLDPIP
ncbi:hypothetical protein BGX31_002706 [Mortierella sp. GBA43]|nr:hypothetical protein BGX31_002706 [Mortierella sp. GBA43]